MSMASVGHEQLRDCRRVVLAALIEAMGERRARPDDWEEFERVAVAAAACGWAAAHGVPVRVSVEDVRRVEVSALGHTDYASKLAMNVAEFVCGVRP